MPYHGQDATNTRRPFRRTAAARRGSGAARVAGLWGRARGHTALDPEADQSQPTSRRLDVAWSYDAQDGPGGLQTHPIIVGGVLYANTPKHRVIALDAGTGKLLWKFDSGLDLRGANRGLTYWAAGDDRRIFAGAGHYVYALDARTGKPIAGFGSEGRIDLRADLGRDASQQSVALTTPGVIYKDMLIVGGRTSEGLAGVAGRCAGLRRAQREAALEFPHHSASRRIRLRHVAEGCVDVQRGGEQLGGDGGG